MLTRSLAGAQRTYSLQVPKNLRLDWRGRVGIELDFLHPPGQQVGRIRPFSGEDPELRPADPELARDTRGFRWAATIEPRHRVAPAGPFSQPAGKPPDPRRT